MMKTITKILLLFLGCLFLAMPAVAEEPCQEEDCPALGGCPAGWERLEGVDRGSWDKAWGNMSEEERSTWGDIGAWITSMGGLIDGVDNEEFCICYKYEPGAGCTMKHGVLKGCEPLPSKLHEAKSCKFCPLFKALFGAVQTMARNAFDVTHDPISKVLLFAFAIYVAFGVLKLVTTITKQDAPKFLTTLLIDSTKFLVAWLLLQEKETIYYYVINPLLSTALDFGGAMLFSAGDTISSCSTGGATGGGREVLPDSLYASLECFIKGVQQEIAFAQAAGSTIMCVGTNEAVGAFGIWDFSMVFSGLAVYITALLLSFAFGFYLIDSVVTLGVLGALMTFFIAAWPFKMTSGYASKGFNMFMNIFFTFVFMGVVVSINTQLIKASLVSGGLDQLEAVLSQDQLGAVKEVLDITGVGFLIILCCCFFGFKFTAKTSQLAGSMAGGGGIDIGAKLGGLLTSGAVNSAVKVAKPVINPVYDKAKSLGNSALNATADAIAHPMKSARKLGGVVQKRFGQAQMAAGMVQGATAAATGNESAFNQAKGMYEKGKENREKGQERINTENEGMHGTSSSNTNYNDFDGNNDDKNQQNPQVDTNQEEKPRIENDDNQNQNNNENSQNPETSGSGENVPADTFNETSKNDSDGKSSREQMLEEQLANLQQQLDTVVEFGNAKAGEVTELKNKIEETKASLEQLRAEGVNQEISSTSSGASGSHNDSNNLSQLEQAINEQNAALQQLQQAMEQLKNTDQSSSQAEAANETYNKAQKLYNEALEKVQQLQKKNGNTSNNDYQKIIDSGPRNG